METRPDTALLVVDVQVGQIERPVFRGEEVLALIRGLLKRARAAGVPVVHVRHEAAEGELFERGSRGWEIHPSAAPDAGEPVVAKRAADAFHETGLREVLDGLGVRRLVVAGCRTDYCIDTTCRRATTLGYDVTLAADAHTTTDNDVLRAAQIIAHHNATLDDFGDESHAVTVRPAAEIEFR
jgi:nicotinamidase-related amidase